jgi:phage terminase small subunit
MYKTLTTKQKRFTENHIIRGMSIAESVRRAGYQVKSGRSEDYGSLGCRILKTERVSAYVTKLRNKVMAKDALSIEEKRAFLAKAVRSSPAEITPDSPLCQEYREDVDNQGNVRRQVKLVNKLQAIEIDNKMSGHNYADTQDHTQTNPFLFLVSFFGNGSAPAPAPLPAPAHPPIDADLVD